MKKLSHLGLVMFALLINVSAQKLKDEKIKHVVTLDHRTTAASPIGRIGLYKNEKFVVIIRDTAPGCFDYNGSAKALAEAPKDATGKLTIKGNVAEALTEDTKPKVKFDVVHDGETTAYEFKVTKRNPYPTDDCKNVTLSEHTWTVSVETYAWAVGLAGAFTGDNLTDRVFSLKPETRTVNNAPVQGFTIQEDRGNRDAVKLGAAVMLHLYHTDPESWGGITGGKRMAVAWAPLSFGLGVGQEAKVRYFIGTSLRFEKQLFLTAGGVFGSVSTLPNGTNVGDFTTNANAIATLGSKIGGGFFVSLSYNFLNPDQSVFTKPFKQTAPK